MKNSSDQTPKDAYINFLEKVSTHLYRMSKRDTRYSILRLLFFILAVALLIWVYQVNIWVAFVLTYVAIYTFYRIILRHQLVRKGIATARSKSDLIHAEIAALDYDFSAFDEGSRFQDGSHPYSSDLDIFGKESLIQMMNRCTTATGQERLAEVLKKGHSKVSYPAYQQAIIHLEKRPEWRHQFYALGQSDFGEMPSLKPFVSWLVKPRIMNISSVLLYGLPVTCWIVFVGLLFFIPWHLALVAFIPTAYVAIKDRKVIDVLHAGLYSKEKYLNQLRDTVSFIEQSEFDSTLLNNLKSAFSLSKKPASKSIHTLKYILNQLNLRYNFFGIILNLVTLWDHYWARRLEEWKENTGPSFVIWIDHLATFEMVNSLATFAYNHPDYTYAEINTTSEVIGKNLVHPLIHRDRVVPNDLHLPLDGHITIVTGSNMGGKSTYLRTCGINIVLARCATRVGATSFKMPYLSVITSMRTQDALQENVSSFYAELQRLQMVLKTVQSDPSTIFLLDEILKGTNSNDRHKGAKAIIRQLIGYRGSGMISTHDLELGEWAKSKPAQTKNVCFEVEVQKDQLKFDYKLKAGVSKSFNATLLMQGIGIKV